MAVNEAIIDVEIAMADSGGFIKPRPMGVVGDFSMFSEGLQLFGS